MIGPHVANLKKSLFDGRTLPVNTSIQTEVSTKIIRDSISGYREESPRISDKSPIHSTLPT